MKNYTNYKRRPYYYNPKKPVKSFQDLEIYQKTLELSVFVANVIVENFNKKTKKSEVKIKIVNNLAACALNIPHLLAESHSCRFGTGTKCLDLLDEAMLQCNKAVVYLEQTRDICDLTQLPEFVKI